MGINVCLCIFKGRSLLELGGNNAIIGKATLYLFAVENSFGSHGDHTELGWTLSSLLCCVRLRPNFRFQSFTCEIRHKGLKAEITRKDRCSCWEMLPGASSLCLSLCSLSWFLVFPSAFWKLATCFSKVSNSYITCWFLYILKNNFVYSKILVECFFIGKDHFLKAFYHLTHRLGVYPILIFSCRAQNRLSAFCG